MNFLFPFNSMLELLWGAKCIRIHYCNFIQNMIMSKFDAIVIQTRSDVLKNFAIPVQNHYTVRSSLVR